MIQFTKNGLSIDERGWYAADPREESITIYFDKQVSVTLDEKFLRHAADLLDFDKKRRRARLKRAIASKSKIKR